MEEGVCFLSVHLCSFPTPTIHLYYIDNTSIVLCLCSTAHMLWQKGRLLFRCYYYFVPYTPSSKVNWRKIKKGRNKTAALMLLCEKEFLSSLLSGKRKLTEKKELKERVRDVLVYFHLIVWWKDYICTETAWGMKQRRSSTSHKLLYKIKQSRTDIKERKKLASLHNIISSGEPMFPFSFIQSNEKCWERGYI